jgi:hypothetical protein
MWMNITMASEILVPCAWTRIEECGPGGFSHRDLKKLVDFAECHLHCFSKICSMLGFFVFKTNPPPSAHTSGVGVVLELFHSFGTGFDALRILAEFTQALPAIMLTVLTSILAFRICGSFRAGYSNNVMCAKFFLSAFFPVSSLDLTHSWFPHGFI